MARHLIAALAVIIMLLVPLGVNAEITVAVFNGASPMLYANDEGEADGLYPQILRSRGIVFLTLS